MMPKVPRSLATWRWVMDLPRLYSAHGRSGSATSLDTRSTERITALSPKAGRQSPSSVTPPARPESNVTGFTNFYEYGVSSKWLALLKEIAPSVSRVAILQNPNHPSWVGYQSAIAKSAPLLGVQPIRA